jgi:hypothetical protein
MNIYPNIAKLMAREAAYGEPVTLAVTLDPPSGWRAAITDQGELTIITMESDWNVDLSVGGPGHSMEEALAELEVLCGRDLAAVQP